MLIEKKFYSQSLKALSTLGIGGSAKYYFAPQTIFEMQASIQWAVEYQVPLLILGKGSNSLFDDRGYHGLVLHNKIEFCNWEPLRVFVSSGYSFSLLGVQSAKKELSGLEFAAGIPGSVGGAIFMNAGAANQQTASALESVLFLHKRGEIQTLMRKELNFCYRFSSFQTMEGCILAASFSLYSDKEARNRQLKALEYRRKTQPYRERSAGSIFQNPSPTVFAGELIDKCGFKGVRIGGAQVSLLHANFIVNRGNARACEVKELIQKIQEGVFLKTRIWLEPELRFISYDS